MVTGASSGIGRATAVELGARGYHVVAAGRSEERTMPVVDGVVQGGGSAEFIHLDLASLESARRAAEEYAESGRVLDVLVNNAGVGGGRGVTEDGFEIHFGVNHLGHFMLTHHLGGTFRPGSRIVVVTSEAHRGIEGIDFDAMRRRTRSLVGWKEYGVSKLANILFVRELAKRQPDWRVYAVHPGMTDTGIFPGFVKPFFRNLKTPEEGAETVVWCATSDDVGDQSGLYYSRKREREPSDVALDNELAAELWRRSEQWCGGSDLRDD
jgi:NAD(P)-dependent dehydrogenase (short-subunit alcohol dehydrogenase family)